MSRRWVVFDVGEVLIDETRIWSTWADVLGVPRFTLMAALGAAIARGADHNTAFPLLGFENWRDAEDLVQEHYGGFAAEDLYPDALPALAALRNQGHGVGVIANQPARRDAELRALGVNPDVMAMSEALGVEKPAPAFFAEVVRLTGATPADIAYVGDRLDNDVAPAAAAGLRAVWLRRGPWARLQHAESGPAALVVDSLSELGEIIDDVWRAGA